MICRKTQSEFPLFVSIFLLLHAVLISFTASAQNRQVCITVDDLPVVAYGISDTAFQKDIMQRIVLALEQHRVPAVGFVNGKKAMGTTGPDSFQIRQLRYWLDHHGELGNHTYSHPDYNKISMEVFGEDILKGEELIRPLLAEKGLKLRYFRHPFLRTGATLEKSDSLAAFLSVHGYTVAPVTIDNDDYLFAFAYHQALQQNDTATMNRLGRDYLAYLDVKIDWFERQSEKLFGRPINQVFLCHASRMTADYMDQILLLFEKKRYRFISLEETLKDPLYLTPITVYGKWGISWLDRWALSTGKTKEFFEGEPDVPEYVKRK
jgi:peptidoglycan/xylan/chitin deacetylase (PgdA/CDA1 family)